MNAWMRCTNGMISTPVSSLSTSTQTLRKTQITFSYGRSMYCTATSPSPSGPRTSGLSIIVVSVASSTSCSRAPRGPVPETNTEIETWR